MNVLLIILKWHFRYFLIFGMGRQGFFGSCVDVFFLLFNSADLIMFEPREGFISRNDAIPQLYTIMRLPVCETSGVICRV